MPINFPNQSRSYDATRCAVHFWGYDSAMERSFFIAQDALKRIDPEAQPAKGPLADAVKSRFRKLWGAILGGGLVVVAGLRALRAPTPPEPRTPARVRAKGRRRRAQGDDG